MHPFFKSPPRSFLLVGHRGAAAHAPENTMSSFKSGVRMGADALECDIHLSKDGVCIVIHDEKVSRTTSGSGFVHELRACDIRSLDAGSWFSDKYKKEPVPLLTELLAWAKTAETVSGAPLKLVIELKVRQDRDVSVARKTVEAVRQAGMMERVLLISFDTEILSELKKSESSAATGYIYDMPGIDAVKVAEGVGAAAICPRHDLVDEDLVKNAASRGLAVSVWTVDEEEDMRKMAECGVHAMTSNFPDRLNDFSKDKEPR